MPLGQGSSLHLITGRWGRSSRPEGCIPLPFSRSDFPVRSLHSAMANFLAQFQTIKSSCDRLVVAIEDVSDLWPVVKDSFEEKLPLKKACLNNKTRNPIFVDKLPVEYILTTDARLRSRFPQEQYLFWFREPYATIILVTCEDLDEFKNILRNRLKLIVQNDDREWFIVFVSKAYPSNDQATKLVKKIYAKLEVEFNTKKRERCCKLDLQGSDTDFWADFEYKLVDSIRNTMDRRTQFYEDEIRKLSENRLMPVWNFCNFFILKESLAFMFEMAHLHEDSLREYDELELCYLETVNTPNSKQKDFGGLDKGDDQAAILKPSCKPLSDIILDDTFREFEFRQYLFACQSKNNLPFCLREVWVITACLALINETAPRYDSGLVAPDVEKEFYRVQGDLYSLCRVKFMRLACLIGYGMEIERSPANSASLSMLPWPKPATWPLVPSDTSHLMLEPNPRVKPFGIQKKLLPLEPSVLLREANRRRASLSAGNIYDLFDGHQNLIVKDGPASDGISMTSPLNKAQKASMSRVSSGPGNVESSLSRVHVDRPMKLSEVYVAAEHALHCTVSDSDLWESLSSVQNFEKKYLELTKGAADNYHLSWWKRHGVVLDGEIGALAFRHGNFDLAAKSYEKVCALYAGEGWHDLLAEVLPNLAECQKQLNDQAGYLSSCVRLLSLERSLFLTKEREAFQSEVVRLAHSEMKHPVPLDVSSLITFSGNPGPPLELCDGDPGTLSVTVWSGFPDDISLESLSLTLIATFSADEGVKAIKSSDSPILKPGKNNVTLLVPPQHPGSYVLGVLTGQIGQLRFRSHSFSKGDLPDSDDFMSYEKPTRPVLKVSKPRPLVDVAAAVSSALLMNETQWVGLVIRPINYSLKGAILHIETGPGLYIDETCMVEMEADQKAFQGSEQSTMSEVTSEDGVSPNASGCSKLVLKNGELQLPDWASNITSILWFPVRAVDDQLPQGTYSVVPQKQSVVDGMRTIALKLEFGTTHNQTFERTIAVHFTDPFHVSVRVADQCNDGTVILHSQVKGTVTVYDAWLELQDGFIHVGKFDGRPVSEFFPLVICSSSRAGLMFCIRSECISPIDDQKLPKSDSILNVRYGISGNRAIGAHLPMVLDHADFEKTCEKEQLLFKCALALQRPVLDPCLAVGFLPFPSKSLRVGQLVNMKWRIERLKNIEKSPSYSNNDEVLYEVNANPENWMIAGRKRGHVSLSLNQGSRLVITIVCMPLAAGYVRPPHLTLPSIDVANISCNPAGPHLVCVLPPALSSSFCIPS
ncbi:Trafficking particle complex II-specific subunit 130-like protein [Nymphaea thermarum]|nr:Trafficking particle complex II-specific subunit 130-like protein [Nymphaea thermarum]